MQPCNFDGILYQLRHLIFSHSFHQKIRFKRNFKKRPKSDFRQKSIFLPYSDALMRVCMYVCMYVCHAGHYEGLRGAEHMSACG